MAKDEEKKKFWVVELEKSPDIKVNIVTINVSWVKADKTFYPTDSLEAKDGDALIESFLKLKSFSAPECWQLYSFKKLDCFGELKMMQK